MSAAFQRSRLGLADANGDLYLSLEYPFVEHPAVTEVNHSLDEAQVLYSLAMAASGWIATKETEYIGCRVIISLASPLLVFPGVKF